MHRFNVRCCCDGERVLGTLDLPSCQQFQTLFVPVDPLRGSVPNVEMVRIELREFNQFDHDSGKWVGETAVYSEDRPIEFWRLLRGFNEGARVEHPVHALQAPSGLQGQHGR